MGKSFQFVTGNLLKIARIPLYLVGLAVCKLMPRNPRLWVFGSHAGFGEGAKAVALAVTDATAQKVWLTSPGDALTELATHNIKAVPKNSLRGFWYTARAGQIFVTHGLGDVNRYGSSGAILVQLWHGAPLKKIHFDSQVTTSLGRFGFLQKILTKMYSYGAGQVTLYVAGSHTAAARLRSAFQVAPGKVKILGDPRHDELFCALHDPQLEFAKKTQIMQLLDAKHTDFADQKLVLYAPTWRDGAQDPAAPNAKTAAAIAKRLADKNIQLVLRSHPLGAGEYAQLLTHPNVHWLGADKLRDITGYLCAFDAVITDYSAIAVDYAATGRPLIWLTPDLETYSSTRGLYEPLGETAGQKIHRSWEAASAQLCVLFSDKASYAAACALTMRLQERFYAHGTSPAAARVIAAVTAIRKRQIPQLITAYNPKTSIFLESFYGKQVSDNPLALAKQLRQDYPAWQQFWSVISEQQTVPQGAIPLLVGSPEWFLVRKTARLLIVNDWLRYGYRRAKTQTVLQTWHGTMLKNLALARPNVSLRTKIAVWRESRRWNYLLSQNPHSSRHFRKAYLFSGQIWESGYPRCDALANATSASIANARKQLKITADRVLLYAPTWRAKENGQLPLQLTELAAQLGSEWTILVRTHTRAQAAALTVNAATAAKIVDVSSYPDINTVLLAADLVVTDYSSVMFDAAVTGKPLLFFVPDLAAYAQQERGFSFDFVATAPGPLLQWLDQLVACVKDYQTAGAKASWIQEYAQKYASWQQNYLQHEDGYASKRVLQKLVTAGVLPANDASA